ncbi:transposase [Rubinisphaera sp. JC750]|uniref:transposase n=1 Tax=Rubinisphaera sp. JC750 TaxID=2898658 RepID=UPI001F028AD1|nr:transposase [Rubinisphaera sp. JC750]
MFIEREPLAYFLTWVTYGSWLPGDRRGWTNGRSNHETPVWSENQRLSHFAKTLSSDKGVRLSRQHRRLVEKAFREVSQEKRWPLLAVNVRTNHVHSVIVSDQPPERVMTTLKAWASRRLNDEVGEKKKWWARHGSTRYINEQAALEAAIKYVLEQQDVKREPHP